MTVRNTIARAVLVASTVLFAVPALAACRDGDSPDDASPRDPSARGPYAVGVQRMTFERMEQGEPRPLDTWIWYPAEGSPADGASEGAEPRTEGGPYPLIIFSHGSGGKPELQSFFTEHLASWGYVVAAPPHPGNTSDDCILCSADAILKSAPQRPVDVRFVFDGLVALRDDASSALGQIVDTERAAIAGHSFGGWTAVFLAGDERFDAAIAMAPGAPQTLVGHAKGIEVPVLIFNSEQDRVVDPAGVRSLSEAVPAATQLTFVSFAAGTHLAYIDRCFDCLGLSEARGHELTNRYAIAFLELHLRGDERYAAYLGESIEPEALVETR